ncbi:co-chaperone GroES [Carnobacteriaceae bacterium zg-ZUI252]|nr:co-chaperone GroES [Carnobacteriaceae bacterium zg-ZUI252]QTU82898.1 co-chaperone GroES [Carnobacteriaceae bacterium zg-C25]
MIKPLSKRVVLQPVKEEEKKVGGLLLPGSAKVNDNMAKVIAVADDVSAIQVNDTVIFEQFEGLSIEQDGEAFIIIKEDNIVAIVQ